MKTVFFCLTLVLIAFTSCSSPTAASKVCKPDRSPWKYAGEDSLKAYTYVFDSCSQLPKNRALLKYLFNGKNETMLEKVETLLKGKLLGQALETVELPLYDYPYHYKSTFIYSEILEKLGFTDLSEKAYARFKSLYQGKGIPGDEILLNSSDEAPLYIKSLRCCNGSRYEVLDFKQDKEIESFKITCKTGCENEMTLYFKTGSYYIPSEEEQMKNAGNGENEKNDKFDENSPYKPIF